METGPRKYGETGLHKDVWKAINGLIDHLRRISPLGGDGIKVTRSVNGSLVSIIPEPVAQGIVAAEIKQYRVKSVADDHLVCREFNGTSESGGDVLIAKPFNLRKTGWDGVSVTYTIEPYPGGSGVLTVTYAYISAVYRTASVSNFGIEHQVILPRYVPNRSVIFASASVNGTGVPAADLVDVNVDGRAWGRVL